MPRAAPKHRPMPQMAKVHSTGATEENYGKGRGGRPWRRLRALVLKRDGYLCQCSACQDGGIPALADEVDHVIPVSQGGTDCEKNLQAINRDHHRVKTAVEAAAGRRRRWSSHG